MFKEVAVSPNMHLCGGVLGYITTKVRAKNKTCKFLLKKMQVLM